MAGRILADAKRHGILREPPRPGVRRYVERAHRTHVEEFYAFYDGELTMGPLHRALREWEAFYNEERPHQSLVWRTPMEYLAQQRMEETS